MKTRCRNCRTTAAGRFVRRVAWWLHLTDREDLTHLFCHRLPQRRPPMEPEAIPAAIVSLLEDYETDEEAVPSGHYADVAAALTESWLKDRRRATASPCTTHRHIREGS